MVDVTELAAYKDVSTKETDMKITVVASKGSTTITRLVAGVELALKQSGKSWTLSASKKGT
jgi:hypothetical protein